MRVHTYMQKNSCLLCLDGFLLGLLINPEYGCDVLLRNVVFLRNTRRYNTEERTLHVYLRKNMKSNEIQCCVIFIVH
jgi:hypothetical protein